MNTAGRILIADDELRNRQLLHDLLEPLGHQLTLAENGREAVELAAQTMPDLILLDVMMPELDGFEVCRQIRLNPAIRETAIVMVTSMDDRESRLESIKAGADDFLSKPVDAIELKARVQSILRLNRYRRLNDERRKFEEAFQLLPEGLLLLDADLNIRLANDASVRMFGFDPDLTLPNNGFCPLLAKRYRNRFNAIIRHLRSGAAPACEMAVVFQPSGGSGNAFPAELSICAFERNETPGFLMAIRDVSERKLLEAQFLRSQRVQTLGSLAGGIAHDLNNVLTPISIASELMGKNIDETRRETLLETIQTSVRRGADIVRQILLFARGDDGDIGMHPIGPLIEEIEKILFETLPPMITLKPGPRTADCVVHANRTHLHQVLMNLCVNARDAMPGGGGISLGVELVNLSAAQADAMPNGKPGTWVRASVEDTGSGMPPEVLEHLGDAFFTTKSKGKGTGLGLNSVFRIVAGQGGFVDIASEVGKGSTVSVYLPPGSLETEAQPAAKPAIALGQGQRLLLCDDDAAILAMTKSTLECFGYSVETAVDGAEALALFHRAPDKYDAVVTDVMLPFVDGYEIVETIFKTRASMPVMLMSGSELLKDETPLKHKPNGVVLSKPFTAESLLAELSIVLRG